MNLSEKSVHCTLNAQPGGAQLGAAQQGAPTNRRGYNRMRRQLYSASTVQLGAGVCLGSGAGGGMETSFKQTSQR